MLRNVKSFRLFFAKFLVIGFFANSLLPQACFCGEACWPRLQVKAKASLSFIFHVRCLGTQCKSCNSENAQTHKVCNATHSTQKLNTLNSPFILSKFLDYQLYVSFIKNFLSRSNRYVKVQSPPMYLQNLSLLL